MVNKKITNRAKNSLTYVKVRICLKGYLDGGSVSKL